MYFKIKKVMYIVCPCSLNKLLQKNLILAKFSWSKRHEVAYTLAIFAYLCVQHRKAPSPPCPPAAVPSKSASDLQK
jgi:hypothetical protein